MEASECIIHKGRIDRDGYGRSYRKDGARLAHRIVWEAHHGPIPAGMVIDHLCWNRACVNIDHLRLLPTVENCKRQRSAEAKYCKSGHLFDEKNTYFRFGKTSRQCRACNAIGVAKYNKKKLNPASSQSQPPTSGSSS